PGRDVADRNPYTGRRLRLARDGLEPGLPLHQAVVGLHVRVGTFRTVSADVAGDEPRVRAPERLGRETDALRGPRRQVLHEHIRPRDETPNERAVFRVLQVGDVRFLAPVEPHEVGAVAVHHVVVAAREVSSGALDLDHARTGVGHLARGER